MIGGVCKSVHVCVGVMVTCDDRRIHSVGGGGGCGSMREDVCNVLWLATTPPANWGLTWPGRENNNYLVHTRHVLIDHSWLIIHIIM